MSGFEHFIWITAIFASLMLALVAMDLTRSEPTYLVQFEYPAFDPLAILRRNTCIGGASSVSAYMDGAGQIHGGPVETSGCIP